LEALSIEDVDMCRSSCKGAERDPVDGSGEWSRPCSAFCISMPYSSTYSLHNISSNGGKCGGRNIGGRSETCNVLMGNSEGQLSKSYQP
jgi:hypothetical protein